MVRRLAAFATLAILVGGAAGAQDKVTLVFTAKAGQVVHYKSEVVLTSEGEGRRRTYNSKENRKVTVADVAASGDIALAFETESGDIFVNGSPVQAKPGQAPPASQYTITVRPDLSLVAYQGPRAKSPENLDTRIYRATTPAFAATPVGLRDTWSREFPADRALGTRTARGAYEVLGFEKVRGVDCVKITWLYEEEGAEAIVATTTAWVEKATGATVKAESTIENVPADASGASAKGRIKQERVGG